MPSAPTPGSSGAAETHALLLPDVIFEFVLYLDFHTLLRCQRVCHTWKSVIDRSREARQTLFLEASNSTFAAFKAAEEHGITARLPPAFQPAQQRIPLRPEFRALFNPWIYMHGCEPICSSFDGLEDPWRRRQPPIWRFTDRVSSGRLDFCFTPAELVSVVDQTGASWDRMFLTQPPVRRVLITVQGGYMPAEYFDLEKDRGVKIGDVVSWLRDTKAVKVMRERKGDTNFTTVDLKFDEHFTGVRFMPLPQLVTGQFGDADAVPS
ncbi:hypothetical protein BU25DRAFT_458935 [Macroventuria anomochaeta]|uniref:Uncharacterized protein n=1 Tax=Macroventuria anomochaeta TaxID=301207 RepID=A0ACB6S1Q9_9PLEO|nr:uncharacterized protein BU25DRAFT_458935 [Macroventuria anomochaeta]KAF2627129.1 hypothetical protein BU25DRAFT_458935 [Macroventuria anomochaeta]